MVTSNQRWHHCALSLKICKKRFTKRLPELRNLSYKECLNRLNLVSLELGRLQFDLIMCYNLQNNLWFSSVALWRFFQFSPVSPTRGHHTNFFTKPPMRRYVYMFYGCFLFFLLFSICHNDETTVLGNAWTDFHENFTKRQRGKWSFQRHTEMGARQKPPNNFLGLKTDILCTGATWRFFAGLKTDKSYVLVSPPGESLRISVEHGYLYGGCIKKAWSSECI